MSEQFTIRRDAEGPGWPFGAGAVAAGSALLGGIVALATPMTALDWLAYQSYLDQIAGLTPPLGGMAKAAFALLLAVLLGAVGFAVARWIGVRSTGGFADLLARLRGARAEDEEDAPRLRGSDRHPDAPARRPLSATRDLVSDRDSDLTLPMGHGVTAIQIFDGFDDDDDELLLVSPMPAATAVPDAAPVVAAPVVAAPVVPVVSADVMQADDAAEADDDDYILPAPHADDWLVSPAPAPVASATLSELRAANERLAVASPPVLPAEAPPVLPAEAAPVLPVELSPVAPAVVVDRDVARRPRPATPPPLDLSVARLDELIARVEAGLLRRAAVSPANPVTATVVVADEPLAPLAPLATVDPAWPPIAAPAVAAPVIVAPAIAEPQAEADDPSFPHDPALAAALATLRRMAAA